MLVSSHQHLISTEINNVTLMKDETYFYTDRTTYDACLLIANKFKFEELIEEVNYESQVDLGIVDWFGEILPKPLNVLAVFLLVLDETPEWDVDECVKALHVITNTISPYKFLTVPKEVRRSVEFSLSIINEAELTTLRFLNQTFDFEEVKRLLYNNSAPVQNHSQQQQYQSSPQSPTSYAAPTQANPVTVVEDVPELDIATATEEQVAAHPDWVKVADGVYVNNVTDDTMIFETEEDQEFDTFLEEQEEAFKGASKVEDTTTNSSEPSQSEKDEISSMIL